MADDTPKTAVNLRFAVSLDDMLDGYAIYADHARWLAARQSVFGKIRTYWLDAIGLLVQAIAAFLFLYVLWAFLAHGAHMRVIERKVSSWIGFFGFNAGYFGLMRSLLRARVRRSVAKTLRRSDPDLFTQERTMQLRIDDRKLLWRGPGRMARIERSTALHMAETDDMLVLITGSAMIPIRKARVGTEAIAALKRTGMPSAGEHYFHRWRRLEQAQLFGGVLIVLVNFCLFFALMHRVPVGRSDIGDANTVSYINPAAPSPQIRVPPPQAATRLPDSTPTH